MTDGKSRKFQKLSWDDVHQRARCLAAMLKEKGIHDSFSGLVAVTRGGLVPAAIIAQLLGIRVIETISVVGYAQDDTDPAICAEMRIVKSAANVGDGSGWLLVDDLVDTGRTAAALRKGLPKAHFATLYAKPAGRSYADTFVEEIAQDTWLYFPWEISGKEEMI